MTDAVLTPADLPRLKAQGLNVPAYERAGLMPGVVHLGLGAFHRAHQALVFDQLLAQGDTRWGIFGVAMRSTQLADALAAQAGLYALQIASRDGVAWQASASEVLSLAIMALLLVWRPLVPARIHSSSSLIAFSRLSSSRSSCAMRFDLASSQSE